MNQVTISLVVVAIVFFCKNTSIAQFDSRGYKIDEKGRVVGGADTFVQLVRLLDAPSLRERSEVLFHPEFKSLVSARTRESLNQLSRAIEEDTNEAKFLPESDQAKRTVARKTEINRWVNNELSPTELSSLDRLRLQEGFRRYGAFIFEAEEATTLLTSEASEVKRICQDMEQRRKQLVNKFLISLIAEQMSLLEEVLTPANFSSFSRVLSAEGSGK